MLKVFSTIFDRCLFTVMFIFGVQLPEFMQQYMQRLSGHLNEAQYQLQQYQTIADTHFHGSLPSLIERYQTNSDTLINETGNLITALVYRITTFEQQLSYFQQSEYINQLYYLLTEFDPLLTQATLEQFKMAIPLQHTAILTGVFFAFSALFITSIIYHLVKLAVKPKKDLSII